MSGDWLFRTACEFVLALSKADSNENFKNSIE